MGDTIVSFCIVNGINHLANKYMLSKSIAAPDTPLEI